MGQLRGKKNSIEDEKRKRIRELIHFEPGNRHYVVSMFKYFKRQGGLGSRRERTAHHPYIRALKREKGCIQSSGWYGFPTGVRAQTTVGATARMQACFRDPSRTVTDVSPPIKTMGTWVSNGSHRPNCTPVNNQRNPKGK